MTNPDMFYTTKGHPIWTVKGYDGVSHVYTDITSQLQAQQSPRPPAAGHGY